MDFRVNKVKEESVIDEDLKQDFLPLDIKTEIEEKFLTEEINIKEEILTEQIDIKIEDSTSVPTPSVSTQNPVAHDHPYPSRRHYKRTKWSYWFYCEHCDYQTRRAGTLQQHIKSCKHASDDKNKWWHCDQCDYRSLQEGDLKVHKTCEHTSQYYDKIKDQEYHCDHCNYKSKFGQDLRRHYETYMHTAEDNVKWFYCDQCDYKSRCAAHFKTHIMANLCLYLSKIEH